MSFFKCCQSEPSKYVYEVRRKDEEGKIRREYLTELTPEMQNHPDIQGVVKQRSSQFPELSKKFTPQDLFTDPLFPPSKQSLGDIYDDPELENSISWKRIGEIVPDPQLIVDGINPEDIKQKNLDKCYFLSTIATLAEKEKRIKDIFYDEEYHANGLYRIKLRVEGYIKDIIVDDFVPVEEGVPVFCQPNENQIWVMILEKAWAKLKGSYENISQGNPTEVFKAVTYAPSELFPVPSTASHGDRIWEDVEECLKKGKPICAGTKSTFESQASDAYGLVKNHFYTVLQIYSAKDKENQLHHILKLRNPWGKIEWNGKYSEKDIDFWGSVPDSDGKLQFLGGDDVVDKNDGIFFIGYQDFCEHFETIHICHLFETPHYEIERVFFDGKHAQMYKLKVTEQGEYIFELHQSQDKFQNGQRLKADGEDLNRTTLIILKTNKEYDFINGVMTYDDPETTLRVQLLPGKYLIYMKVDPDEKGMLPFKTSISCYSSALVSLKKIDISKLGNFEEKMFLEYARSNKRKLFNKEKMWMSWKQLYSRGGFAFVGFGVDIISNKKFVISFDEKDFNDMNYTLKKPYKGQGKITLQILPGEEKVIVARVKKGPQQEMKFPPNIDVKIEKIVINPVEQ